MKVNLRSIREPVNRRSWSEVPPTIVNAFYDPSRNHIREFNRSLLGRNTFTWYLQSFLLVFFKRRISIKMLQSEYIRIDQKKSFFIDLDI